MSRRAVIRTHAETQGVKLSGQPMRFLMTSARQLAQRRILQQA
jgi:hypothetical protein